MSFFQNPFVDDFEANWVLGDRQHIPKFVVKGNSGRGKQLVVAWNKGPYNLSGNDTDSNSKANLQLAFRLYNTKNWATISIDVTVGAGSTSSVKDWEVAAALNASAAFSERFVASIKDYNSSTGTTLIITQRKPLTEFTFYIINGRAEEAIKFNARAGVAELPTFFARHTIANRFTYDDSQGCLIYLNPATNVDAAVINNAVDYKGTTLGYSSSTVHADWQLLKGKSGIFQFQKLTVDVSDRITQIIAYSAGSVAGDLAKKTTYTYSSSNKSPSTVAEIPYTLESGDLITP